MKLLVDNNSPPALVKAFLGVFPGSKHVFELGMSQSSDEDVWAFAKENNYVIVSKDKDILALSIRYRQPPKLIHLKFGNSRNSILVKKFRDNLPAIQQFEVDTNDVLEIL